MYNYLSYFLSTLFIVFSAIIFWFILNIKQFKKMD